eukprot:m.14420 g.14420  ORF g.14420 m.14420 type:complete len:212 (+) comp5090_c0_seq1:114-749(+)
MPPPPPPAAKPGKVEVYRAQYDYSGVHADELNFSEGDLIYVSKKNPDGWWEATVNGKKGIVPGNYLEAEDKGELVAYPLHEAAKRGNIDFLKECLLNKVSVNGLDKSGSTPLHWAARGGHVDCVREILKVANVQVDVQNKLGDTPLHGAAWKGQSEIISMILEKGANRRVENKDGEKPYDLATKSPEAQQLLRPSLSAKVVDDYADSDDDE